jgi:hypothetical protein
MAHNWKQPTPTDIQHDDRFTALDRAVFREILALCQNKDTLVQFIHNERHYAVELKRGQCIFRVSSYAKSMGSRNGVFDPKRVSRSIKNLSKWYSQMDSQGMPYGLVITVKNYDSLVSMDSQMDSQRIVRAESKDSQRRPNKSVKSVKSVESGKRKAPPDSFKKDLLEIRDYFNQTFNKEITSIKGYEENAKYWLEDYGVEQVKKAIENWKHVGWWPKPGTESLVLLFRKKNRNNENVDYIGELLGSKQKSDSYNPF